MRESRSKITAQTESTLSVNSTCVRSESPIVRLRNVNVQMHSSLAGAHIDVLSIRLILCEYATSDRLKHKLNSLSLNML